MRRSYIRYLLGNLACSVEGTLEGSVPSLIAPGPMTTTYFTFLGYEFSIEIHNPRTVKVQPWRYTRNNDIDREMVFWVIHMSISDRRKFNDRNRKGNPQ